MHKMRSESSGTILPRTHTEAIGSTLFQAHTESSGTTMPQMRSEASGTVMPQIRNEENEATCLKRTLRHRERAWLNCNWPCSCIGIRSYRARDVSRDEWADSFRQKEALAWEPGLAAIICDWKRCYGLLEATRCSVAGVCSCRVNTM